MVTNAAENRCRRRPRPTLRFPPMNEDGHVLKSRRGLLAAGLAVAVVGALGVASTLNAGAEQIPGTYASESASPAPVESATSAPAAPSTDAAADLTPPAKLPWGAEPEAISQGSPGESSGALRAAGLDAAPADASGSTEPEDAFAPKGRTAKTTFLKSEQTDIKPPEPPAPSPAASTTVVPPAAAATSNTVNFLYNVGSQAAVSDGLYATITIAKPKLATADYHTLAELALESADGQQIVEVGWNVDRTVNGDDDPHLFVYHWINQATSCYNGCGFVQYSSTIKPGDTLAYDTYKKVGIQYFNGAWWIAYDSEWVGYFPEQLWLDKSVSSFSKAGLLQVFGEVAAASTKPCTAMGNGITPDQSTSAFISSVSYINGPTVALNIRSTTDVYAVNALSARTFRYGGPGVC